MSTLGEKSKLHIRKIKEPFGKKRFLSWIRKTDMRRLKICIPVAIAILLLLFAVNFTSVSVLDKETRQPIAGVKVNFFYTNNYGKVLFLDTAFDFNLSIARIGFTDTEVRVPYMPVFRSAGTVFLERASFDEIKVQVSNWAVNKAQYEYIFASGTSSSESKISITGKKKGDEYYFNFSQSDLKGLNSVLVISKADGFYVSEDGSPLRGPLTEQEKEEFINKNIVFIELSEVLNEMFYLKDVKVDFVGNSTIYIKGEKGNITIFLDNTGEPRKISIVDESSPEVISSTLTINTKEVKISKDEN